MRVVAGRYRDYWRWLPALDNWRGRHFRVWKLAWGFWYVNFVAEEG